MVLSLCPWADCLLKPLVPGRLWSSSPDRRLGEFSNLVVTSQALRVHTLTSAPAPLHPSRVGPQNRGAIRGWRGDPAPQLLPAGTPTPAIPGAESGPVARPSGWVARARSPPRRHHLRPLRRRLCPALHRDTGPSGPT